MVEYKVVSADWIELAEGYGYWKYEFEKVKPVFAEADFVVGNLETMIFPEAPYRTEKYVSFTWKDNQGKQELCRFHAMCVCVCQTS